MGKTELINGLQSMDAYDRLFILNQFCHKCGNRVEKCICWMLPSITPITAKDRMIKIWKFEDAPMEYQKLSTNGGDEDWIAFIPKELAGEYIGFLEVGNEFAVCNKEEYRVDGGIIIIGSHA